ncbi:MAG: phosphoglycerate dehydrogenase [Verrucomicrobiales bacterium]|nr:phosphoglycerate dehydrogenase [Verrucomicrobiales bacterium]
MSQTYKVLVADGIAEAGIEELKADPALDVDVKLGRSVDEIAADIAGYDAVIVRSASKITSAVLDNATSLRAVGRAGVGVDNIDIPAATEKGVVVMNTPAGNTISTAEHAFTLMVSLCRNIPQAHASMAAGRWDRKKFQGTELDGKTLAVLGMGRIGTEYARRAMAFGMRVVAYDPYLSQNRARLLRVELFDHLDDALRGADVITMHMPLTDETKHMINAERIENVLKPGVRIINCARGGLIDEAALGDALDSGKIGGAALDVYETEPPPSDHPLLTKPNIVLTPHLGASTHEAQENVGIEIARQIRNYLVDGAVVNAVNTPSIDAETATQIGPYLELVESMGRLLSGLAPARPDSFRVNYSGKVGDLDTTLITRSALKGFLEQVCTEASVNMINATGVAENLGLSLTESRVPDPQDFSDLIEVTAGNGEETATVAGTIFGGQSRIVRINGSNVEADPEGTILLVENDDTPGIVGRVGTLLGENGINIAQMSLSRNVEGGRALAVLNLDSAPDKSLRPSLESLPGVLSTKLLSL